MALNDRFRIDELVKKGSKAVDKDISKGIVVRKKDGKEVRPVSKKEIKPYGVDPIRGKQKNPKIKTDLLEPDTVYNEEQTSFAGETVSSIERPIYNEDELKKAVDVEVDELLKKPKEARTRYVKEQLYNNKLREIQDLNDRIKELTEDINRVTNENSSLQSQIDDLTGRLEAAEERLVAAQLEFDSLLGRYETLLADFQNAVIKGTKEGIERVSLTAQVRGLGAQKETLASQLDSEKEIVKTLQETIRTNTQIAKQQIEAANQQVKAAQATASTAANSKKKKIICNELYHQGYLPEHIWDADEKWGDKRFVTDPKLVIGYQMWARKVVEFMRRKPQYTPIIYFLCKPWTEWMAYDLGVLPKNNLRGQFTQWVGRYFSYMVYDLYGGDELYQRYLKSVE